MTQRTTAAIVLAAGLGKRMKSTLPKVLHPICGAPLLDHVLAAVQGAGIGRVFAVTGHGGERVRAHVGDRAECVDQPRQLGTGHAVMMAEPALTGFEGDVLVTCGDTPLMTAETFRKLIARRAERGSAAVVLTAILERPGGYGRIVRAPDDTVLRIVEHKDATAGERAIREVNTGTYCFDAGRLFAALRQVGNQNAQGEYYLTDVLEILRREGHKIDAAVADDPREMLGVNSRRELAEAGRILNERLLRAAMDAGVTVVDPATTWVDAGVAIGHDAVIEPFTILKGKTVIGEECRIGPGCELVDARVGAGARVRQSVVEGAEVPAGAEVGPFAHLRA